MTNVLDKIAIVLNRTDIKKGFMPDKPDNIIGLFEYSGSPPVQTFGRTDPVYNVQARIRATDSVTAYAMAESVISALNHYADSEITILQSTAILDIGCDGSNPARQEYTVNFIVRRI